jgi:hypothetical protein
MADRFREPWYAKLWSPHSSVDRVNHGCRAAWAHDHSIETLVDFAAKQGYDLRDYVHGGCVADWWGFTWMILAEARGRADLGEAGRRVVRAR